MSNMMIENVPTADLGRVIAQLVAQGLTFRAWPRANAEGLWNVELTGGY